MGLLAGAPCRGPAENLGSWWRESRVLPVLPPHLHSYQPQDLPTLSVPLGMSPSCVSLSHLSQKEPGPPLFSSFLSLSSESLFKKCKQCLLFGAPSFGVLWSRKCSRAKTSLTRNRQTNPLHTKKKKKKTNLNAEDRSDIPRKKHTPL